MADFKTAFAAARKSGKKEFDWNGKKYNTKLKGEGGGAKAAPTSKARPKARPSSVSQRVPDSTRPPRAESASLPKSKVGAKEKPAPSKVAPGSKAKLTDKDRANIAANKEKQRKQAKAKASR